jgi:16S rRNA (uracil1498-N3)-methyltransferase
MADRYFVESPITGEHAQLIGPEAHHLAHVMRAQPGDAVTLFDGGGAEFVARVTKIGRSAIELAIESRQEIDRELPIHVSMGVAIPKGDRQRWLVEKLTELGVARLVPLITTRGVAQPAESSLARLRRGVIEASKQCGRNRLMEIAPIQAWREFVVSPPSDAQRYIAHPGNSDALRPQSSLNVGQHEVYFAVGPEGGFTDSEVKDALAAGWLAIDLGPRILRVETAAITLVAAVNSQLNWNQKHLAL